MRTAATKPQAVTCTRVFAISSECPASSNAYRHGKPCLFFFYKPVLTNGLFSYETS